MASGTKGDKHEAMDPRGRAVFERGGTGRRGFDHSNSNFGARSTPM